MPTANIILIGASAGGLDPLLTIVSGLPPDFPAALFVVQHIAPTGPSLLPEILDRAGPLGAQHATDGAPIERGCIYIAPPDHHMLVRGGHLHVVRGPRENGFRPAIDATFRTAAQAFGPRTIGIVLSGMLDDGTAGLLAIKRRGGVAIVQSVAEAAFPAMPESAARYVDVDLVLNAAQIPAALTRLANEPVAGGADMTNDTDLEANISGMNAEALNQAETIGTPAPFSCPDCGGVMNEYYDGELLRFRCQVGHAFSPESMFASQAQTLDRNLWAAYQSLDERITLSKRLAYDARRFNDDAGEHRFSRELVHLEAQREQIRQALVKENGAEASQAGND